MCGDNKELGALPASQDRATAVEPVPVSPLRDGIPSADKVLAAAKEAEPRTMLAATASADNELRVALSIDYEGTRDAARSIPELERRIEAMPYDVAFLRARAEVGLVGSRRRVTLEYRFRPAQAIEARRGETRQGLDPKDESAVSEADAPKSPRQDISDVLIEALEDGQVLVRSLMRQIGISDHIVMFEGQPAFSSSEWRERVVGILAKPRGEA